VLVCSSDERLAKQLYKMFREQRVLRQYWAVTVNAPEPRVGKINIPLMRHRVSGHRNERDHDRIKCSPFVRFDEELMKEVHLKSWRGTPATTYYRTLTTNNGAALMEYQPRSSFKHQIRVHSAEALSCPIIGDHKYSNYNSLKPQRLSNNLLNALAVKQSKVRSVPMHLHLRQLLIPDYIKDNAEKPHMVLVAKTPGFFDRSLKRLGLRSHYRTTQQWHGFNELSSVKSFVKDKNINPDLYVDPTAEEPRAERRGDGQVYVKKQQIWIKKKGF